MKPYRLWNIQVHVREKFRSPSALKGTCTWNLSDEAGFKFYCSRAFKSPPTPPPCCLSVCINFNLWFCCCFFVCVSLLCWTASCLREGPEAYLSLYVQNLAFSRYISSPESPPVLDAARMEPPHSCCPTKILSKPNCPWARFITVFNSCFYQRCLSSSVHLPGSSFGMDILMTQMLIARSKSETPHKIWERVPGPRPCWRRVFWKNSIY